MSETATKPITAEEMRTWHPGDRLWEWVVEAQATIERLEAVRPAVEKAIKLAMEGDPAQMAKYADPRVAVDERLGALEKGLTQIKQAREAERELRDSLTSAKSEFLRRLAKWSATPVPAKAALRATGTREMFEAMAKRNGVRDLALAKAGD